jgi:hypothetical protein
LTRSTNSSTCGTPGCSSPRRHPSFRRQALAIGIRDRKHARQPQVCAGEQARVFLLCSFLSSSEPNMIRSLSNVGIGRSGSPRIIRSTITGRWTPRGYAAASPKAASERPSQRGRPSASRDATTVSPTRRLTLRQKPADARQAHTVGERGSEGAGMWIAGIAGTTQPPALTHNAQRIQSQVRFPRLSCAGDAIRAKKPPGFHRPGGFDSHYPRTASHHSPREPAIWAPRPHKTHLQPS